MAEEMATAAIQDLHTPVTCFGYAEELKNFFMRLHCFDIDILEALIRNIFIR
jgi:hypothetical protein